MVQWKQDSKNSSLLNSWKSFLNKMSSSSLLFLPTSLCLPCIRFASWRMAMLSLSASLTLFDFCVLEFSSKKGSFHFCSFNEKTVLLIPHKMIFESLVSAERILWDLAFCTFLSYLVWEVYGINKTNCPSKFNILNIIMASLFC